MSITLKVMSIREYYRLGRDRYVIEVQDFIVLKKGLMQQLITGKTRVVIYGEE